MKEILLTQGKITLVDDEDYEWLNQRNWSAGKNKKQFYAMSHSKTINKKRHTLRMHRVIMGITDPKILVDHRDGNGLNNQRSNLRIATTSKNCMNRGVTKGNKLGIKGVCFSEKDKKYMAYIMLNKKQIYLGRFNNREDAVFARKEAEKVYHGEFAPIK